MHQPARAEKDFHGGKVGMAARPENVDQAVLFDLLGHHMRRGEDMLLFMVVYVLNDSEYFL